MAAQVLMNLGLDLEDVRQKVLALVFQDGGPRGGASNSMALLTPAEQIASLARQLKCAQVLLGALVGTVTGGLLVGRGGLLFGLVVGMALAGLGRFTPGVLAGSIAGAFAGTAQLGGEGGGIAGAVLGVLFAACVIEVGRRPRRRGPS